MRINDIFTATYSPRFDPLESGLCTQAASSKVVVTLQEVIRVLQGLIAALERRMEK